MTPLSVMDIYDGIKEWAGAVVFHGSKYVREGRDIFLEGINQWFT